MKEFEEFSWALTKLKRITIRLKMVSSVLLLLSLLNVSIILGALGRVVYLNSPSITVLGIFMIFMIFVASLLFDNLRKEGKSFYDEISGVSHAKTNDDIDHLRISSLELRIRLRSFMLAYDIPLLPGKHGPSLLLLLNIIIVIIWVVFTLGRKF